MKWDKKNLCERIGDNMYRETRNKLGNIPGRELPQGIEDRIQSYSQIKSIAIQSFDVIITNYLAKITNSNGVYRGNREELITGLRGELIQAYSVLFEAPKSVAKLIESIFNIDNDNSNYLAQVLARDFIRTTGFNDELKGLLLTEELLEYSIIKKFLMQRIVNNLDQLLMGDLSSL